MRTSILTSLAIAIHILYACDHNNPTLPTPSGGDEPTPAPPPTERLRSIVRVYPQCEWDYKIEKLDIFVYGTVLKEHRTYTCAQDSVWIVAEQGEAIRIAAIANAFGTFNENALRHYDAWEALELNLSDETPSYPIMGGKCTFTIGQDAMMELSPLLCAIELRSIEQAPPIETALRNPRVWLENAGSKGALFHNDRQPSKEPVTTAPQQLPNDIGLYTQYPGLMMYCYPNEVVSGPANPPLRLVLEYEKDGTTLQYKEEVHPVLKGSRIPLDIVIR